MTFRFNNGNGALTCDTCGVIYLTGAARCDAAHVSGADYCGACRVIDRILDGRTLPQSSRRWVAQRVRELAAREVADALRMGGGGEDE